MERNAGIDFVVKVREKVLKPTRFSDGKSFQYLRHEVDFNC